jgi:exonuclease I
MFLTETYLSMGGERQEPKTLGKEVFRMKKILSHVENDPHSMAHDSLTEVSSTQKGKSRKSRKAKPRRLEACFQSFV